MEDRDEARLRRRAAASHRVRTIESAAIAGVLGLPLWWRYRRYQRLEIRDAFAVAVFGWIVVSAVSGLPFVIHGSIPSFTDAFFEMMSGYTTSGATILTDIEVVPHGLLFWRSQTHLLGGMGFLTLTVIFLPHGMGGVRIFRAESSPGQVITKEKFIPRNRDTMIWLCGIYLTLNVLETALLCFGGMSLFDSLCHSFGTVSTSGYSPKNASIGHYNSAYFDWVITLFMFLAGVNFSLHYLALRGKLGDFIRNEEFLFFSGLAMLGTLLIALLNMGGTYADFFDNLRYSAFQVVSILTTTGFGTADYELWPVLCQYLLVFAMFIGGCAGSTGGGMKVARILLLFKHAHVQIYRLIHPRAVRLVKLGDRPVAKDVMQSILGFFAVYLGVFVAASFIMAGVGMDLTSSAASVIATLSNIGPGLGQVGPTDNYAHLPELAKGILVVCMLMGRLELYTVLVLLLPTFWRK